MKYKGIVFDLDGVICFTDRYHYRAWKQAVASLGVPFDETVNNRLRGVSRMDSLNIIWKTIRVIYQKRKNLPFVKKRTGFIKNYFPDCRRKMYQKMFWIRSFT